MYRTRKKYRSGNVIVEIHKLMKECVNVENIQDWEFVRNNLKKIVAYKGCILEVEYSMIEEIFNEVIVPPFFDEHYFDFLNKKEFGSYDAEGNFVINSEESLKNMLVLLCERSIELERRIDEMFSQHWLIEVN